MESECKGDEGGLRFIDFNFPFYELLRKGINVQL
jgi:hypothetical protein